MLHFKTLWFEESKVGKISELKKSKILIFKGSNVGFETSTINLWFKESRVWICNLKNQKFGESLIWRKTNLKNLRKNRVSSFINFLRSQNSDNNWNLKFLSILIPNSIPQIKLF